MRLTIFTSTPWFNKAWAAGLEESRVTPRILNWLDKLVSAKMARITEPPCFPVAPKTVMIFDMVKGRL